MKKVLPAVLIGLALLALGWFVLFYRPGAKYDNPAMWRPSYHHTDNMPFGMELFDSVMATSLPKGYQYKKMSTIEACRSDSVGLITLMYVDDYAFFDEEESNLLLQFVARGNNLLIVADGVSNYTPDQADYLDEEVEGGKPPVNFFNVLGLSMTQLPSFNFSAFKDSLAAGAVDSIRWVSDRHLFHLPPQLLSAFISTSDRSNRTVADVKVEYFAEDAGIESVENEPVLIQRNYGKGRIVVAANTCCFTNFGVLHPEISAYVGRTMALVADKPVVRYRHVYNGQMDTAQRSESPLKFILAHRPTRWALYVALAAIVLFFIFRARRRQRVIPVMPVPENKSVELAQVLGTIYFRRGDHRDLLCKKYRLFAYELRKKAFVDVADPTVDNHTATVLANITGMDATALLRRLQTIREAMKPNEEQLDKEQMQQYIDFMNNVVLKV